MKINLSAKVSTAIILTAFARLGWSLPNFEDSSILPPYISVSPSSSDSIKREMSPEAIQVPHDFNGFGPNPQYVEEEYDAKAQYEIYGGKKRIDKVLPLIQLGEPLYTEGALANNYNIIGQKNLVSPQFIVSGDLRTAVGYNYDGAKTVGVLATRLNLETDLRLTGTERIHALFRPLDQNGLFTDYQFLNNSASGPAQFSNQINARPNTLFFEGDIGSIASGIRDKYVSFDLPFAFGLMPMVFQNGIWVDAAFQGAAFSIPHMHSKFFDISNMDITFFGGNSGVNTPAINVVNAATGGVSILAAATFIETQGGYIEAGYGSVMDNTGAGLGYNNMTLAFTKRYGGWLSNSTRVIVNSGQDNVAGKNPTASGYLVLLENSLITRLPSTLIPYFNLFYGNGHPQSLARDPGAGGVLKNTGLSFETDGLTGFPKLDDTGNNTYGGALGIQYLFSLNRQFVAEVATVQVNNNTIDHIAKGNQYAFSMRYQQNLNKAWIFRTDTIFATRETLNPLAGIRFEIRRKF